MQAITKLFKVLVLALVLAVPAGALSTAEAGVLDPYKAQGLVGERPDGFAGIVRADAPGAAKAMVADVNAKRRAEYQRIAKQRATSVAAVQAIFGQRLIAATRPGQYFMNPRGQWVKK